MFIFPQSFSTLKFFQHTNPLQEKTHLCNWIFEIHCFVTTCPGLSQTGEIWGQKIRNKNKWGAKNWNINLEYGEKKWQQINTREYLGPLWQTMKLALDFLFYKPEVWTPLWLRWKWHVHIYHSLFSSLREEQGLGSRRD